MTEHPDPTADKGAAEPAYLRRIRSFVLREGRMTPAQQRAFDAHWSRFGLDYTGTARDFTEVFGRQAPRVMEIGFGNGEALAWASEHDPERDYIGIEVHRPGVGRLMNALAEQQAQNVRVYRHDAVEVLRDEIAPGALNEVRILFPDPWPKKRHHKRRIVQPAFAQDIRQKLAIGGVFHMATDWENYAEHMLEVMSAAEGYENTSATGNWVPRPDWRPLTKFEQRGHRLGHGVWDLIFKRVN